jgi:hypothetical protein
MSKYWIVLCGMMLSGAALAANDSGVVTSTISIGNSQAETCGNAKRAAGVLIPDGAQISNYGDCTCSSEGQYVVTWTCSVDAYWKRES